MKNIYSNTIWEKEVAYCRAKRAGNLVVVSGTTAIDDNGKIIGKDVYEQSKFIFKKMNDALQQLNCSFKDVVRTRTFITNIDDFAQFAKAHKESFDGIDPVATCVEVSRLVNDELLIEIEIDAYINDSR